MEISEGLHTALMILAIGAFLLAAAFVFSSGPRRVANWLNSRSDRKSEQEFVREIALDQDSGTTHHEALAEHLTGTEPVPISPKQTRRRIESLERTFKHLTSQVERMDVTAGRTQDLQRATEQKAEALGITVGSLEEEFNRYVWLTGIKDALDAANAFYALTQPKAADEAGGFEDTGVLGPLERAIRLEELIKHIESRGWEVLTTGEPV